MPLTGVVGNKVFLMKTVFITGADRGIGLALCGKFAREGWHVLAGQYMPQWKELDQLLQQYRGQITCIPLDIGDNDSVKYAAAKAAACFTTMDMLINCAGIAKEDTLEGLYNTLNVNAFGVLRMTEAFLPLMENGQKRLCFFSSEAGSITMLHRNSGSTYCVSKTVMNMTIRLMFNQLQKQGYIFRVYHPGWVKSYMSGEKSTVGVYEPEETVDPAYDQFVSQRSWEDVLVMTDIKNELWPF